MTDAPAPTSAASAARKRVSGVVVPNAPSRKQRVLAWMVSGLIRVLAATLRYRVNGGAGPGRVPLEPAIFAFWHNRLALCLKAHQQFDRAKLGRPIAALISASKDGAFLAAILDHFHVQPVRGSSSRRGAQALIELTTLAGRGYDIAVTPDGPRGPCYVVQDGVISLAQITGHPIVPYSCQLGWKISLKSWDRFQIPLPFSRCEMTAGDPIRVPRNATEAERARLREQLQAALLAGTHGE